MPPVKEFHYFDQLGRVQRASSPRRRDERDVRFLENLVKLSAKPHGPGKLCSTVRAKRSAPLRRYLAKLFDAELSDEVIRQITRHFPNLKMIFLARDPVERVWSHLSMEVHYRQIEPFDVTDIGEVNRRLVRRGMLLRSYPSAVVARWKRYVDPERFRIFFFDDLKRNPGEQRRPILSFLGADPDKVATANPSCGGPGGQVTAEYNSWAGMEKLPMTDQVRSHLAQFFKKELKTCAARLGGPARHWPARYGFP
jgi:hypothetical protein